MNISYDSKADALYIQFQKGKVKETLKIIDGLLVDVDQAGRIFGIEILDASYRITPKTIETVHVELPIKVTA
jgi:uncharacterized protein YuzE